MATPPPTPEELATLTDSERAALLDDSMVDEGELLPSGVEAVIPDDQNILKVDNARPAPEPAPAPVPAADTTVAPAPAAIPAAPAAPATPAPAPVPLRDFDKEIGTVRASQSALAQKFDDGDLTATEYESQRQQLDDRILAVRLQQHDAVKSVDDLMSTFYSRDVPTFIAAHPAYAEGPRYDALNAEVVRLQNAAIAAAGGNESAQFNPNLLQQAFDKIEKGLGATVTPAPGLRREDPATRVLPPNISAAPAAAADDDITDNSRWAALNRLGGEDFEQAFARLSEADQQAYLQSN